MATTSDVRLIKPPPKPPIICYDLQTQNNARKSCLKSRSRMSRRPNVVVRKDLQISPIKHYSSSFDDTNQMRHKEEQFQKAKLEMIKTLEHMCRELEVVKLGCKDISSRHVCFKEPVDDSGTSTSNLSTSSSRSSLSNSNLSSNSRSSISRPKLNIKDTNKRQVNESSLLEVTDIEFFKRAEDQTLIELHDLLDKMEAIHTEWDRG